MKIYRGSYVSLTAIVVFVGVLAAPLLALAVGALAGITLKSETVTISVSALTYVAILAPIITYYLRLRVWLSPDKIVKRGLFSTTTVPLTPFTRFKMYTTKVRSPNLGGAGALIESMTDEHDSTRYYLTVENEGKTIKLGSTLKNVHEVVKFLHEFEMAQVLARLRKAMSSGEMVDSGGLRQSASQIHIGKRTITRPLTHMPLIMGDSLHLQYLDKKPRKIRVRLKTIWNPGATRALLAEGVPGTKP